MAMVTADAREQVTLSNQTQSILLRLPGEIRDKIYHYASLEKTVLVRSITSAKPSSAPCAFALLHTCRQIAREASPIAYALCNLDLSLLRWPSEILRTAGHDVVAMMQAFTRDEKALKHVNLSIQLIPGSDRFPALRRVCVR
ncbi:hypothetical protein EK21DRAFT_117109 [Setomelanomma holmii]|uniref:Uncharacterized protein n=1 Tax=Setomelanomma holmii TaxID=210430 RepID=A0A9P4H016_9PLEO|nr:hypothetical protein EK21DRAFT_117109 [Setomelanomma holmii]